PIVDADNLMPLVIVKRGTAQEIVVDTSDKRGKLCFAEWIDTARKEHGKAALIARAELAHQADASARNGDRALDPDLDRKARRQVEGGMVRYADVPRIRAGKLHGRSHAPACLPTYAGPERAVICRRREVIGGR